MKITAVFKVHSKAPDQCGGEQVQMHPPYAMPMKPGETKSPEDTSGEGWKRVNDWSKYTPSGSISMQITNPAAAEAFEQGKTYLVTFEPYEE